jgi:hypothetical protein
MSGFSAGWLALRKPADLAARHPAVLEACTARFAGRASVSVCDVGAGTGASVRALSHLLPPRQLWTLVDDDDANLAVAGMQLAAWAECTEGPILHRSGREFSIRPLRHDLAPVPRCWTAGTELVVASAFFDLVSEAWIGRFVEELAAAGLPLLATLTFDGLIVLDPPHRLDPVIAAAFTRHQGGDKGFGPAAGPESTEVLAARLAEAGYELVRGKSPWRLSSALEDLRRAFVDGVVQAVTETTLVPLTDLADWAAAARDRQRTITVGHDDLFAAPS